MGAFGSRGYAMQPVNLTNLRNHAQAITLYMGDAGGVFRLFLSRGSRVHSPQGGGVSTRGPSYFDMHQTWHIALADRYLAGDAR